MYHKPIFIVDMHPEASVVHVEGGPFCIWSLTPAFITTAIRGAIYARALATARILAFVLRVAVVRCVATLLATLPSVALASPEQ